MTDAETETPARWDDHVIHRGAELARFWHGHFQGKKRHALLVLGRGFDPRTAFGLRSLRAVAGEQLGRVVTLDFPEGDASASHVHAALTSANAAEIAALCGGGCELDERSIEMWSGDGRRIGSANAAKVFRDASDFSGFTDVFIDVSALPRSLYFPLLARVLEITETEIAVAQRPNVFVLVSENVGIDAKIADEGLEESASFLRGFQRGVESEATSGHPRVWIPLLGESQLAQLQLVYDLVRPDEVCPVLPFPSKNPRRGDDLVQEYRVLLFEQLRIDPGNIIYASEANPFDVYAQVRRTILHYRSALLPLGGCKAIISAHSTKLLSVGALLVAHELRTDVAIAHVEPLGHVITDVEGARALAGESELVSLWLGGECYAA